MIYILQGEETVLIKQRLKEIIKDAENYDIEYFDSDDPSYDIEVFLASINSTSLLSDKRYIVFRNPDFFINKMENKAINEALTAYAKNPSFDLELIFYEEGKKFKSTLNLMKAYSQNAKVEVFNTINTKEFAAEVFKLCKQQKINISNEAINYLINASQNKLTNIYQAIKLFTLYNEPIDINNIKYLVNRNLEDNSLKLANAITDKDLPKAFQLLDDILTITNAPQLIIASLAGQFRYLYQVAYFNELKYDFYKIKELTKTTKDYRLQVSLKTVAKIPSTELLKTLALLSNVDTEIKTNDSIDAKRRLEIFLIKLIKGNYASN